MQVTASYVLVVFAVSTFVIIEPIVRPGIEARDPLVAKNVPDDGENDESTIEGERDPLNNRLPGVDAPVVKNEQPYQQSSQGAAQMAHEPGLVAPVSEEPDVDG